MEIVSNVPITPRLLAEAFWNLDSNEQANFFEELYNILDGKKWPAHSLGEMQWLYMSDAIEKSEKAKTMATVLASHIFVRATNYLSKPPSYGDFP